MARPLALYVACRLARFLGRERTVAALSRLYEQTLAHGPQGAQVERVLTRVLRRSGQDAAPERLRPLISAMVKIHADVQATVWLLEQTSDRELLDRVELPLLGELERLRQAGSGVILASPHFGNVALTVAGLALSGVPVTMLVINAQPFHWAERGGLRLVDLGASAVDCVRALARGETVFLLSDIDYFPDQRTAEFFGAPIRPPHGPARLALACRAPILPVYAIDLGGGRYRIDCDRPIEPREETTQEELESRLLRSQEAFIARHPSHWWVLRDIWDFERYERANRRRLAFLNFYRRLPSWLGA